jgi:hypothetical protein
MTNSTVPGSAGKKRPPGGSRKGIPNKATRELKEMILAALDGAGGIEYLQERAKDPRTASAFLTLVGKVLPMTIAGDKENPLQTVTRIELVPLGDNGAD